MSHITRQPKASAALSRRCLQHLLREKGKVKPGKCIAEVLPLLEGTPQKVHVSRGYRAPNATAIRWHYTKSASTPTHADTTTDERFCTLTDQWTRWDTWKERLGVFFEYAVGVPLTVLVAIGMLWLMFSWVVDDVLPAKWSNTVKDVFTTVDQKRAQADTLSEFAASLRMEADQELKQL